MIVLCSGETVLIDAIDYDLKIYNWSLHSAGYAEARINGPHILMHTVIGQRMGLKSLMLDHKNENKLDNRRSNLRETNHSLNGANRKKQANNTSGYKGVFLIRPGVWRAKIQVKMVTIYLGTFYCPKQAAISYNIAAKQYFGEFASLNEVQ